MNKLNEVKKYLKSNSKMYVCWSYSSSPVDYPVYETKAECINARSEFFKEENFDNRDYSKEQLEKMYPVNAWVFAAGDDFFNDEPVCKVDDFDIDWYSYSEKCSIINEFFEKYDLTYLRGKEPSDYFDYDFSDETFTMKCEAYSIEIQTDGYINVRTEPGFGIGEFDIEFIHNLNDIKDELIECLEENCML